MWTSEDSYCLSVPRGLCALVKTCVVQVDQWGQQWSVLSECCLSGLQGASKGYIVLSKLVSGGTFYQYFKILAIYILSIHIEMLFNPCTIEGIWWLSHAGAVPVVLSCGHLFGVGIYRPALRMLLD